jgi:malate dehydrogenase
MKKVAIIGAGNVGGTTAMRLAESGLASVVLVDIAAALAQAKVFDLEDSRYALGTDSRLEASSDFSRIDGADAVVITAGLPRKPGMTREDLLAKNAGIVTEVCASVGRFAPRAVVIVVSNPLDAMTYLAFRRLGWERSRIFGMGVNLDSSRFANLIAKRLFESTDHIEALVIGSHGETMLPIPRLSSVRGKPLTQLLPAAEVEELVKATRQRGAQIVSLYGSGSAYYAPSAAILQLLRPLLTGESEEIPVSAVLDGEYGLKDVAIGVPARIGPLGVEEILKIELAQAESQGLQESAQAIKDSLKQLSL